MLVLRLCGHGIGMVMPHKLNKVTLISNCQPFCPYFPICTSQFLCTAGPGPHSSCSPLHFIAVPQMVSLGEGSSSQGMCCRSHAYQLGGPALGQPQDIY